MTGTRSRRATSLLAEPHVGAIPIYSSLGTTSPGLWLTVSALHASCTHPLPASTPAQAACLKTSLQCTGGCKPVPVLHRHPLMGYLSRASPGGTSQLDLAQESTFPAPPAPGAPCCRNMHRRWTPRAYKPCLFRKAI